MDVDCSIVLGSLYPDMSPQDQKKDDAVFPGGSYTYTWTVPEDHSPTADDPNCLTWIYHSHIDAPKDIASGLIGPLVTCKEGKKKGKQLRTAVPGYEDFVVTWTEAGWKDALVGSSQLCMENVMWLEMTAPVFWLGSSH